VPGACLSGGTSDRANADANAVVNTHENTDADTDENAGAVTEANRNTSAVAHSLPLHFLSPHSRSLTAGRSECTGRSRRYCLLWNTGRRSDCQPADAIAGTVFTLGDHVYEDGTPQEFNDCYQPSWGGTNGEPDPAPATTTIMWPTRPAITVTSARRRRAAKATTANGFRTSSC
jgi:hypothetical protein